MLSSIKFTINIKYTIKFKISKFLKQPYPFYYNGKALWIICAILFIMSLFFNYFFEPFEVYVPEHKLDYFWISFIHSTTPIFSLLFLSIFANRTNKTWTVRKEVVFVFMLILIVGIVQFLIRDIIYDNENNWSLRYLIEEIRNTFLVGSLFILILVPLNFNRLNSKNAKKAKLLNLPNRKIYQTGNSQVTINTKLIHEKFQLDIERLIFAKIDGNYVELYLLNEKITKVIKRITISELESILKPFSNVIRTHRSYLVNIHHIKSITGNAQGYKIELNSCDESVPVSRNMIAKFNSRLKNF